MILQVSLILSVTSLLALGKSVDHVRKRTFIGDPRRNITCLGSSYDLRLPTRPDDVDLNRFTMQQLCAKRVYGGADIPRALGGWCSKGLEPAYIDEEELVGDLTRRQDDDMFPTRTGVSFEFAASQTWNIPGWPANQAYQDERLYAGCLNRCFCSWGWDDLAIQPKREVPSNADLITVQTDTKHFTELKLEVAEMHSEGNNPAFYNRINDGTNISVLQVIPDIREPNEEGGCAETEIIGWEGYVNLSLDPGSHITCDGDLPSFQLPPPYTNADFGNPQELCAVQWAGGLSLVLRRDDTPLRIHLGGGNFFLSASLRTYCYAHCYCTFVGKRRTRNKTFTLWQFLRNHRLIMHGDGSIDYGKRRPLETGVYRRIARVLPPRAGAAPYASGTCGADGKQFCPAPWPEAHLGPIPHTPPFSTEIVLPPSPDPGEKRNLTVCGNECSGQSDCSPTKDGYGCDCALPNVEDARVLRLDPVAPPSICLSLDLRAFGHLSSLQGRDEVEDGFGGDEEGVPYQCRCNVTFPNAVHENAQTSRISTILTMIDPPTNATPIDHTPEDAYPIIVPLENSTATFYNADVTAQMQSLFQDPKFATEDSFRFTPGPIARGGPLLMHIKLFVMT